MLIDKIHDKTAVIGVVGLGYVGLPLAVAFAREGFSVEGYDTDTGKVVGLRRGHTTIDDVNLAELQSLLMKKPLNFQFKLPDTWNVDVVIICVPTPITKDKKPDLTHITDAVKQVRSKLASRDSMVILESSTYPGTTRDVVLPILDGSARYIAYSPERVDPGSKKFNLKNTPKLVAGIDEESTLLAGLLYNRIVDKVIPVSSLEVAETAKLFENVFRNVNIALVNEMALVCEKIGVSVWEVIDAAATKPFGFMPFYPGVGVGGHCIPVDPYYIVDKAREAGCSTDLIEQALDINEGMPGYIANMIVDTFWRRGKSFIGAKVLVLGVSFKRDVGDTRESPSLELIRRLHNTGADVLYNDPYVLRLSDRMASEELDDELLESADCVVIATDHSCYNWKWIVDKAKLVFDTRNATEGLDKSNIYKLGERKAE